jgi:hypothetical protein
MYRMESAWRRLAEDITAPEMVGIAVGIVIFLALFADIRNRNRQSRMMKKRWHCVDPRNSLDQES